MCFLGFLFRSHTRLSLMTAENPLTGLVPLGYQLGDSADRARYVGTLHRCRLGQPTALRVRSNHGAPDVPFCAAHRISYSALFLVLSSCILQGSEDTASTFFWQGWQRTCGVILKAQTMQSFPLTWTWLWSYWCCSFCVANDIQRRYDSMVLMFCFMMD